MNGLKEAYEDIQRHKADKTTNERKVLTLESSSGEGGNGGGGPQMKEKQWKELKVGDILKLCNDQLVPADCLVLSTSAKGSVCYIETSNLDGESHHKIRKGLSLTEQLRDEDSLSRWRGVVKCGFPTVPIYEFAGQVSKEENFKEAKPFNESNILLRGSTLTNTEWVFALVLYTGDDTKLVLNSL